MIRSTATRSILSRLVAASAVLALTPALAAAQGPALTPELESTRNALNKYQDPIAAVADGYHSTIACMEFPKGNTEGSLKMVPGAMGVHLLNMGNIGPTLDPTKPQVLIYEWKGDKLVLAAAEWFMPAQLVTGAAPTIFGQALQGPMEGHAPIMPAGLTHYDLHVWLWKNNPAGMFSPTNPAVTCPKGPYTVAGDPPHAADGHVHQ